MKSSNFTILSLHRMGDPKLRLEAVNVLEMMVANNIDKTSTIVHDTNIPFPNYLKDIRYDAIILGPTFLSNRHNHEHFKKMLHEYDFIKSSDACKIALPQDDYDSSSILDQWMVDWDIDRVYTVISNHWDLIYPKYIKKGDIKLGYTGYISEAWINKWSRPKELRSRKIDVSYRTHHLSKNRCYLRNLKYVIADRFKDKFGNDDRFNIDISNDKKDFILGQNWHSFIENSKACLVTPSGSSLLDPEGSIRRKVEIFETINSDPQFFDVQQNCYPGIDRDFMFTAISPRNIEAALARTIQIGTEGVYSKIMEPDLHYIKLDEDCSNVSEIKEMLLDHHYLDIISSNCKEAFLDTKRLRIKTIVNELIEFIKGSKKESIVGELNAINSSLQYEHKIYTENYYKKQRLYRSNNKLRMIQRYTIRGIELVFSANTSRKLYKMINI